MRKMLLAAALAFAGVTGCAKSEADKTAKSDVKVPHVTVDDLDKMLAAKEATPVDCNGDRTRKHEGTVPGAILISDEQTYAATELPADKNAKLVFYCANPG
jgi:rhodanese-related sulfurtransferase